MKWLAGWKGQGSQMPGDRFHMIYMLAYMWIFNVNKKKLRHVLSCSCCQ